jgi:cation diffusion facilitator family transporter
MNPDGSKSRAYYGYLEGAVSIVMNLILSFIKFVVGVNINSIALVVDGFHSLSDLLTSFVVILGFKSSQKPADEEHPFGHGRYEDIASLIIAILLAVVGVEFLISSAERLLRPEPVRGNFLFFSIVILTILMKEALARYSTYLSKKIDSQVLLADGWHHRSDALGSIPVALGILASAYGYYRVDALSGILVSIIVIYMGYQIARNAASSLLGRAPPKEFVERIKRMAHLKGVTDIYDIYVHHYGMRKVISLTIKVEPMGLEGAHALADSIEKLIAQELDASVVVHIDGFTLDDSMKEEISRIVEQHSEVISCHAIDIGKKIDFHILVDKDMSIEEAHELAHHLEEDIQTRFEKDVVIHVEPCIEKCEVCEQECQKKVIEIIDK